MDYPFFFYQPWPFFMALFSFFVSVGGCIAAMFAYRAVKRMRALLLQQEERHRAEIDRLTKP